MKTAIDAIDLSSILVREWLLTCMFDSNEEETVDEIVKRLNEHDDSKTHGRHYNIDFCKDVGLKIDAMEDDNTLQDAILSVHHSFMITMTGTDVSKIIENQNGKAFVSHVRS